MIVRSMKPQNLLPMHQICNGLNSQNYVHVNKSRYFKALVVYFLMGREERMRYIGEGKTASYNQKDYIINN